MQPQSSVIDSFHRAYYDGQVWRGSTSWLGVPVQKCPLDLWVYQEILTERRPTTVIETGTFQGGSALYLATVMDALGTGRVLTIDVYVHDHRPTHPRITYLTGSSIEPAIVEHVRATVEHDERIMVILDADHSRDHVLAELRAYAPLVTPGDFLIIEDTNVNGRPILEGFGPGPLEARDIFLAEHPEFVVDAACEKFMMTFNPGGFLRRIA